MFAMCNTNVNCVDWYELPNKIKTIFMKMGIICYFFVLHVFNLFEIHKTTIEGCSNCNFSVSVR